MLEPAAPADAAAGAPPREREVALKVVHPGIRAVVDNDIALLRALAALIGAVAPNYNKYLSISDSIENFGALMQQQLDLRVERYNLRRLGQLFEGNRNVVIPEPLLLPAAEAFSAGSGSAPSAPDSKAAAL